MQVTRAAEAIPGGHGRPAGRRGLRVLLGAVLLLAGAAGAARADDVAARVVIVANARQPDSVALAEFYARVRSIPAANIIALPLPEAETITWREFVDQVHQPLQAELVRRGWIDARLAEPLDPFGRRRGVFNGHRISHLVVCRGVPLRIHHDPLVREPRVRPPGAQFQTTQAAVDAELALLAQDNPPGIGFVPNPLFARDRPTRLALGQVIKVARLDGPTLDDARRLVVSALEGERHGLVGRYYLDLGGPHPDGDRWLRAVRDLLVALDYEGDVEETPATLAAGARFDAPALYFGWYTGQLEGPFRREGFRFPPGAVAVHIHSFSAATLRSATEGWCGPLVARGVAATVGNVFEPYLQLTHRPDLLLAALAAGRTLGDAAAAALPALGWQAVLIGDPLYRPFAPPVAGPPPELAPYALIRTAAQRARQEGPAAAVPLLVAGLERAPDLPVMLALGRTAAAAGQTARAVAALRPAAHLREFRGDAWWIGWSIARELTALGETETALNVYSVLAESPVPAAEPGRALLREARDLADQAGDLARSIAFARRLEPAAAPAP